MYVLTILITVYFQCECASMDNYNNKSGTRNNEGKEIQMIYWKVKPYLYYEKNRFYGSLDLIFCKAAAHCAEEEAIITYAADVGSREKMEKILRSDSPAYGSGILKNITRPHAVMYGPSLTYVPKLTAKYFLSKNLSGHTFISNKRGLVVIVQKSKMTLPAKIINGVYQTLGIITVSCILSVLFGMIIWFFERYKNPSIDASFTRGAGTSIYWSTVTMTTVGYGDIVPVTLPGRIVACIWMLMGVMVAAIMTASLTDAVNGTNGLEIRNKKVAVLKDSYAEHITITNYNAQAVSYESYEDILTSVRNGDTFAAVILYDIAAWHQDEIRNDSNNNPLRIVYTIPAEIPIDFMTSNKPFEGSDEFFSCMFQKNREEIITWSEKTYMRNLIIETTEYESFFLFFKNRVIITLTALTGGLVFLGIVSEFLVSIWKRRGSTNKITSPKKYTITPDNKEHVINTVVNELICHLTNYTGTKYKGLKEDLHKYNINNFSAE